MPIEKHLKLCVDRAVPDDLEPARAQTERALRGYGMELALPDVKKWPNGSELRCRFLDGSPTQKKRVEAKAHQWEDFANLTFKFVTSGPAQIRISFSADAGSWSALGTDALIERFFPPLGPTMNYGWLEDDSPDDEYGRVVVHEFGHAVGAIHEHQSPDVSLKWNRPEVFRVFSGPPNFWAKPDIEHNILKRYSRAHTNSSRFDPKSIMLYAFPGSLFKDGQGTDSNVKLSATDKAFIKKMYPKPS
jgi:hypothetical protein